MVRSEGCSLSPLACFYQSRATPLGIALEAKPPHSPSRSRLQPPMAPRSTAAIRGPGCGHGPGSRWPWGSPKERHPPPGQGLQADHAGLQAAHHLQMACSGLASQSLGVFQGVVQNPTARDGRGMVRQLPGPPWLSLPGRDTEGSSAEHPGSHWPLAGGGSGGVWCETDHHQGIDIAQQRMPAVLVLHREP